MTNEYAASTQDHTLSVIPGRARKGASPESIRMIVVMDFGLALRAPRMTTTCIHILAARSRPSHPTDPLSR